jgi:hypothetical protein
MRIEAVRGTTSGLIGILFVKTSTTTMLLPITVYESWAGVVGATMVIARRRTLIQMTVPGTSQHDYIL